MKKCTVCGEIQGDKNRVVCENCTGALVDIPDIKKVEIKKIEKRRGR